MKRITDKRAHSLSQLHDEIVAAIPALAPKPLGNLPGLGEAFEPVMRVEAAGDDISIELPDGADEAAVRALIKAHRPKVVPPPPDLKAMIADYEGEANPARQKEKLTAVLKGLAR